jgi:UDP-N-acetyl-2-amino-2-deoxyglucuronate dehydrogenase
MRVVIIGAGRILNKHLQAIKFLKKKFKIVGVYDKKHDRNLASSSLCKTTVYKNYNELIKITKPEIVTILVESGRHLNVCKDIIVKHNIKNFIIEKPLDISSEKIKSFENFIKHKNINIFTVKQNRFNKAVSKAKDLIDKKLIGSVFMISASCKWRRDQSYYNLDKWRGKRNLDGGVLMNQAIHHIDLLIHLAGDIKSVVGYGHTRFVKIQSENIVVASLKFKNGCLGTIEATTATSPTDFEGSITIMGSKGTIKIGGFASNKIIYFANEFKTKLDLNLYKANDKHVYGEGHKKFYEYVGLFLDKKIKNNSFDIKSSIKSVRVVEKIILSFKSRKIEKV